MKKALVLAILAVSAHAAAETPPPKFSGSARLRGQKSENRDFGKMGLSPADVLSRFRLGGEFHPEPALEVLAVAQFAKKFGDAPTGTQESKASVDFYQAWMKLDAGRALELRAGRQELKYGDQLVLGNDDWTNTGRTFDAFRLRTRAWTGWADAFAARISATQYLAGVYSAWDLGAIRELDLYAIQSMRPAGFPSLRVITYGTRAKTSFFHKRLDLRAEVTGQTDVAAYQADAEIGVHVTEQYRVSAEAFVASPNYFQVYPTTHRWLGEADFFGRRNIQGVRLGGSHEPSARLMLRIDLHVFQRNDVAKPAYGLDGLTSLGGAGSGKLIATELDLVGRYDLGENTELRAGYSTVSPGQYARDNQGSKIGKFVYLQLNVGL